MTSGTASSSSAALTGFTAATQDLEEWLICRPLPARDQDLQTEELARLPQSFSQYGGDTDHLIVKHFLPSVPNPTKGRGMRGRHYSSIVMDLYDAWSKIQHRKYFKSNEDAWLSWSEMQSLLVLGLRDFKEYEVYVYIGGLDAKCGTLKPPRRWTPPSQRFWVFLCNFSSNHWTPAIYDQSRKHVWAWNSLLSRAGSRAGNSTEDQIKGTLVPFLQRHTNQPDITYDLIVHTIQDSDWECGWWTVAEICSFFRHTKLDNPTYRPARWPDVPAHKVKRVRPTVVLMRAWLRIITASLGLPKGYSLDKWDRRTSQLCLKWYRGLYFGKVPGAPRGPDTPDQDKPTTPTKSPSAQKTSTPPPTLSATLAAVQSPVLDLWKVTPAPSKGKVSPPPPVPSSDQKKDHTTRKVTTPKRVSPNQRLTTPTTTAPTTTATPTTGTVKRTPPTTRSSKPKRPITYKNKKSTLSLKIRSGPLFKHETSPDAHLSPRHTGDFFGWDAVEDALNKVKKNTVTSQGTTGGKDRQKRMEARDKARGL